MFKRLTLAHHAVSQPSYTPQDIQRAQALVDRFKQTYVPVFGSEQRTADGIFIRNVRTVCLDFNYSSKLLLN